MIGNLHTNLKMRSVISHDLSCITQCISTWVRFNSATTDRLGWGGGTKSFKLVILLILWFGLAP